MFLGLLQDVQAAPEWFNLDLAGQPDVLGSLLGTRLALKHGAGFVRGVFIVVVTALILKTGYDAYLR